MVVDGVVLTADGRPATVVPTLARRVLDRVTAQVAPAVIRASNTRRDPRRPAAVGLPWPVIRAWAGLAGRTLTVALVIALVVATTAWIHGLDTLGRWAVAAGLGYALAAAWAMSGGPAPDVFRPRHRRATPVPTPGTVTVTCTVTDHPSQGRLAITAGPRVALPSARRAITRH